MLLMNQHINILTEFASPSVCQISQWGHIHSVMQSGNLAETLWRICLYKLGVLVHGAHSSPSVRQRTTPWSHSLSLPSFCSVYISSSIMCLACRTPLHKCCSWLLAGRGWQWRIRIRTLYGMLTVMAMTDWGTYATYHWNTEELKIDAAELKLHHS